MTVNRLTVGNNSRFSNKIDYLKPFFGTGSVQPAALPRKSGWTILNAPGEIPQKWGVWSIKLFSNGSGYNNVISADGKTISAYQKSSVPAKPDDEDRINRRKQVKVVFTKSSNAEPWTFRGVFILDKEASSDAVHTYKRVATDIEVGFDNSKDKTLTILDYSPLVDFKSVEYDLDEETKFTDTVNQITPDETVAKAYSPSFEKPKPPKIVDGRKVFERDPNVSAIALARAEYKCEYCADHYTFTRKSNGKPYTEAHHLIPISLQEAFPMQSIDVPSNIVSLCSTCHNCIHYAIPEERNELLRLLYTKRKDELSEVGIEITLEQLKSMY